MIGDRERIAIALVAEFKLTLVVGAPQRIRPQTRRKRRSFHAGTLDAGYQPVPTQNGVDGAMGRHFHFRGQASQQTFANLASTPVRLLPFPQ